MTQPDYVPSNETVSRISVRKARTASSEIRRWLLVGAIFGVLSVGLLGLSLVAAIYSAARSSQERPVDAIVVMGAAQFNGVPSAVLQARLDTTFELWEDGLARYIIVTGGKMPGDVYTESESSQMYLMELGVPESAILLENEGRNSADSLEGVAKIAKQHDIEQVLIVSDGFHLFRSKMIARDLGLDPFGVADSNSPIRPWSRTEFDYVLREAAAVVAYVVR